MNQVSGWLGAAMLAMALALNAGGAEAGEGASPEMETAPPISASPGVPSGLFHEAKKELQEYQTLLESARNLRLAKAYEQAERNLIQLLGSRAPDEVMRPALLELAFLQQEKREWQKAQRLFAEFIRRYPKNPSVPEVLFRQAYIYREMGVPALAESKLYAVMSTCINLQLDEVEYYKKLVLRAQVEIAETHYLQGKFKDAADYFGRLLKLDAPEIDRAEVLYKLARSESAIGSHEKVAATARIYLEQHQDGTDAPEMRYLLADALKKLGRNQEALQEILILLREQHAGASQNPEVWLYWRQKAGNDIANQLYREGDYLSALQIYQTLADLNTAPEWQMPVWYQIGLVYENLKQYPKAVEVYEKIAERAGEMKLEESAPAVRTVVEMAAFRKHTLAWEETARAVNREFRLEQERALGDINL